MRTLAAILLFSASVFGQELLPNGDFEAATAPGAVPSSWYMSGTSLAFKAQTTDTGCRTGRQCALLLGVPNLGPNEFGTLAMQLSTYRLVNKRIRFKAAVRVEGDNTQAQLWLRVDNTSGTNNFFHNTGDLTPRAWTEYSFEATVPDDSTSVNLGFIIMGSGKVYVDDASLAVTGRLAVETPEAPRALTDRGLENLVAFAKLAGAVRYFHPSDQAAAWNWNTFVIDGVRAVESAASPPDLAAKLQQLFDPIAPTVRVFPNGTDPGIPDDLKYAAADTGVTRWFHDGLSIGMNFRSVYESKRLVAPISSSVLPAGYSDPAAAYETAIGAGLTARVPTVLYTNSQSATVPTRPAPRNLVIPRSVEDRATRLAGVIIAWNVFQHFYPYFDLSETDMPGELRTALASAAQNAGAADFRTTMQKLVASLKDGHGGVYYGDAITYNVPLIWAWTGGQVIVTRVKDPQGQGVQPGDRVLAIDGADIADVMARQAALESGATPQWIRWRTLEDITACDGATRQMKLDIEPYATPGSRRTVQFDCRESDSDWSESRPEAIAELEPGIQYVDIERVTPEQLAAAAPLLQAATGIVYDFRGYPLSVGWYHIFGNLTRTTMQSEQFLVPAPALPDQKNMWYTSDRWSVAPQTPYFSAKRVFLTDARAISAAETDLDLAEGYKLGEIVGEPTAGTTGNINPFTVPGGFQVYWTGMRILKPNGSRFHGVGIRPTIPASRTRAGIAAGVDEMLRRAVEVVKGPQAGTPPAITAAGIVNGASFAGGAVTAGEIVSIFGTGLGPATGVSGAYDEMGYLSRHLGETRVFFNGIQAPVTYVSSTQVNAIVPHGSRNSTTVRVEYQQRNSNEVSLAVVPSAPGIFVYGGQSQGVIVNQNGSFNSAAAPAARGEIVTFFATGTGDTPTGVDGLLPVPGKWLSPSGEVAVLFDGVPGEIVFKGEIYAGVLQVNVRVPANAAAGDKVPLVLKVDGTPSGAAVTIALK